MEELKTAIMDPDGSVECPHCHEVWYKLNEGKVNCPGYQCDLPFMIVVIQA